MIKRWLPFAVGIAVLAVSVFLHIAHARNSSSLMANGTKVVGHTEWAGTKREVLRVTYFPADQRTVAFVSCVNTFQSCPTGRIDVWVDPADKRRIAIPGGHLSGEGIWRHWTAGLGFLIVFLTAWPAWQSRSIRQAAKLRARVAPLTPRPGQKPRRERR